MIQLILSVTYFIAAAVDLRPKWKDRALPRPELLLYGGILLLSFAIVLLVSLGVPLPSPLEPIRLLVGTLVPLP